MVLNDLVRRIWEEEPNRVALEFKGTAYTRQDLAAWARSLEQIIADAGVPSEAPISLVTRNRPLQALVMLAAIGMSRSLTSHYATQSPEHLAAEVGALRPAVLVADVQDWSAPVIAAASRVGTLGVVLDLSASTPISLVTGLEHLGPGPHRGALLTPGMEILSSGTTGPPKRIALTFDQMARFVEMVRSTIPPGEDAAAVLLMYPLSSVGGAGAIIPNLVLGRYTVLFEKFNVADWIEAVERLRPPSFVVPPTVLRMILDAEVPAEALASVKYVYGGGARLDCDLQDDFERIYDVKVLWAYGATEFCGTVACWTPSLYDKFHNAKRGAVGQVVPGIRLRTVDTDTGTPLPTNSEGYLEALIPEISKDWLRTTDIVRLDEDGFMFHLARGDGAIVRGGFKVIPETIISALKQHPSVVDVAVVGLPDQRLGHIPIAVVEASSDAEPTASELETFARQHLLSQHVPARFIVVNDLPRTGTMKVDQAALLKLVTDHAPTPAAQQGGIKI